MNAFRCNTIAALCVSSLLAISACGGNSPATTTTTTTTTPLGATLPGVYVFQSGGFSPPPPSLVLLFPKSANGAVTPTTVVTGPADFVCTTIAIDSTGNLYLGANDGLILVYAPGARTPTRTIQPVEFNSNQPMVALAVDGSGNIYAAGGGIPIGNTNTLCCGVAEYASTANGRVAATRFISGAATTIGQVSQIAVDSSNNLYIAQLADVDPQSILIFNSTATGNVAPTATIGGSNTGIFSPCGLALDKGGDVYVESEAAFDSGPVSIFEFSKGATGNVAPTRTISGAATMLENFGITVDSTTGNLYTIAGPGILMFPKTAVGNVAPSAILYSTNPLLSFNSSSLAVF
jgi:hypothetical protein